MTREELILELEKLNIKLSQEQLDQLDSFYKQLIEENKSTNLTRITDQKEVNLKHFYDSLTIAKAINLNSDIKLCDIGSGAGFPGIVLKIAFPKLKIVLLDARKKRVDFLNRVIDNLKLENIKAIHSRAEDYNEKFDIVTARAVASLDKLVEYGFHLLNNDGKLIAMKANIDKDLELGTTTIKQKNLKIEEIIEFRLPVEDSIRNLIVIGK